MQARAGDEAEREAQDSQLQILRNKDTAQKNRVKTVASFMFQVSRQGTSASFQSRLMALPLTST